MWKIIKNFKLTENTEETQNVSPKNRCDFNNDSGIFLSTELDNELETTGDVRHNYHNSDKVMEATSTDTTLLPSFTKFSFGYATPTMFSNNELPNIPLPLDVPDGFLNEWWLTFWDFFSSLREQEHNSKIPYGDSFE